jgi:hypothetical protein
MQDQRVSQCMTLGELLSLRQDVETTFSPIDEKNELKCKEEGRPDFADVLILGHVKRRKRDAFPLLGAFLPGFSDSFAHRSSRFGREDGQNSPTASLSGRSSM